MWDPTYPTKLNLLLGSISIHGSRVGPDVLAELIFSLIVCISIHGSRVGPDSFPKLLAVLLKYFNPRVPCGTRHLSLSYNHPPSYISIHGSRVGPDKI